MKYNIGHRCGTHFPDHLAALLSKKVLAMQKRGIAHVVWHPFAHEHTTVLICVYSCGLNVFTFSIVRFDYHVTIVHFSEVHTHFCPPPPPPVYDASSCTPNQYKTCTNYTAQHTHAHYTVYKIRSAKSTYVRDKSVPPRIPTVNDISQK